MNTISPDRVRVQMNKCYMAYDPHWPYSGSSRINGFKYHVEQTAGIKLDFIPTVKSGKAGYELKQVEIIDDPKFTMWLLRWS